MKILELNLKKQWFDMIICGEKKNEYRDISKYWIKRLFCFNEEIKNFDELEYNLKYPLKRHRNIHELMNFFDVKFRHYDAIIFSNGYSKNRKQFEIELKYISIGFGSALWGASSEKLYFILHLGKIKKGINNEKK